jgi:hypothetical protein
MGHTFQIGLVELARLLFGFTQKHIIGQITSILGQYWNLKLLLLVSKHVYLLLLLLLSFRLVFRLLFVVLDCHFEAIEGIFRIFDSQSLQVL